MRLKNIKMGLTERNAPFLFWLKYISLAYIFFVIQRLIAFLIIRKSQNLSLDSLITATIHGRSQDFSVIAYLVIFTTLFLSITQYGRKVKLFQWIFVALTTSLILYIVLVYIADHAILHYWETHLNQQAFAYLKYPQQLFTSLSVAQSSIILVFFILFWGMLFVFILQGIRKLNKSDQSKTEIFKKFLWLMFWFVIARGGLGKIPITITDTYKSEKESVNMLSVNALWNSFYYLLGTNTYPDCEHFLRREYFDHNLLVSYLNNEITSNKFEKIELKAPKNLVIILMEGVSAQASKGSGGTLHNGTPLLDSWVSHHGYYARHCYASSDRTDKGLASVFSGWPGQPWQGILHEPDKFTQLPHLLGLFQNKGFQTYFLYGGDMEFANIKAYMKHGGVNKIIDGSQITSKNRSNWGVNDSDALQYLFHQILRERQPFVASTLLLSSHEPYDVVKEKSKSEIEAYFKSVNYVDRSIHSFLQKCFQNNAFDDTWFLISSDHGKYLNTPETHFGQREFFRIPFAIIGKSLPAELQKIEDLCFSQADIYNTLLDLFFLKIDSEHKYSRSILRSNHPNNALFHMHEVAGLISKDEMHWIGTRKDQINKSVPLNHWDSVILSLESEVISDYFNLKSRK